ncbi:major facilitator superfamily transporter domain-containing protein 1 [Thecamonas trahens ATCC 50062]|uniref:Lysosomal dipeptide transporter MFSD1 n=1 Tax=Thecamonas trahens ATCC 50062 TaxID=461836 RepID=A0A0L0DVI1_THETB|nr:major facilitator superfamily transporter domain-containing protein 1 [Thecamonas trahens ATCC 50062]KNC56071.1 major facilitator superfamily transporter domain-containing protein 1 [Thecamonas trahens ATCC 50062]|eukprot:XP_013761115.1 major facilitator superfamily transporter domain-containing protein 1 [Thecamonas trahens ATCC 50062]
MFLTFGSYWVFDTPGAIQKQLTEWFGPSYTDADNLMLYSVYSLPNTVLPFFSGYLIDRVLGIRLGIVVFCGLVLVGETIFCVGIMAKTYWVCVMGRFVFGLGGESLTVAQNTITVIWFQGPQLALAFASVVAFARIGSSVNFAVTPTLADSSVPLAVWFGCGMCLLSFAFASSLAGLDWFGRERILRRDAAAAKAATAGTEAPRAEAGEGGRIQAGEPSPATALLSGSKVVEEESEDDGETISWAHIKAIPLPAWFIFIICAFFYVGVLTFYTVGSKIMQETGHKYSSTTATLFLSIPNFVSIVASPTFGRLVDKVGRALFWIILASIMMIGVHIMFLLNALEVVEISPIPLMIWLGVSYSMGAASLWPILSLVVPDFMQGTAYGIMTATQNCALAFFPLLIGQLQDKYAGSKKQYTLPLMIFIGCEVMSLFLTFILIGLDRKLTEGRLNMSAAERDVLNEQNEIAAAAAASKVDPTSLVVSPRSRTIRVPDPEHDTVRIVPMRKPIRASYLARLGIHRPMNM